MGLKPLVSVREYYYWSERIVSKVIEANVTEAPKRVDVRIGPSAFGIQVQGQPPPETMASRATMLESLLSDLVVTDLDYEGPLEFLSGHSTVVLSSLRDASNRDTGAVNLFIDTRTPEGKRVGVCLFGSARNVCDLDPEVPAWRRFGWTSSTDTGVKELIRAASRADESESPDTVWRVEADGLSRTICRQAVNISFGQGDYKDDSPKPWHRGYTLGHYEEVEWLAKIYHTDSDVYVPDVRFDVVHVGACLWVRSASANAWIAYTPDRIPDLDAGSLPRTLRPLGRIWYRRRGRHLRHLQKIARKE